MTIELDREGDICVVRVKGRFVTGADDAYLRRKADELKSHNCALMLVDLSEVTAIGSMGIGFLVGVYASVTKSGGGRFVMVQANPRVREALMLTRLNTVIPMESDAASGLAFLRG
jgi:anti-anti-sigma factor